MPAPAILRDVFHALRAELGEEDTGIVFDNGPLPLDRIEVMVYGAAVPSTATVFATVGMSVEAMPSRDGRAAERAEIRLLRQGVVEPHDQGLIAMQLANLATYPWAVGSPVGWGETVSFGGELPTFPGCRSAFLAGPWEHGQTGWIDTGTGPVRVINVVPISDAERTRASSSRPDAFFSNLLDARNIFAPPA